MEPASQVVFNSNEIQRQHQSDGPDLRRDPRTRPNNAHAFADRYAMEEEAEIAQDVRPAIKSNRTTSGSSRLDAHRKDPYVHEEHPPVYRHQALELLEQVPRLKLHLGPQD